MARRGNGEGSVRLRADGRWEARIRLPGGDRMSVYGATRAEASEAAARALRDVRLGVSLSNSRETYSDYLARWLEVATAGKSESTGVVYELAVRRHIVPVIGAVRLCDLAPFHVERVYATMLARGLTDAAVVARCLRMSLGAAERDGLVARNVARLVRCPPRARREMRVFSTAEARSYLSACQATLSTPAPATATAVTAATAGADLDGSRRLWPMLALILYTGLRIGEACALRWRYVDLDGPEPCIRVVSTVRYMLGDPIFRSPKTERSKRLILLAPHVVDLLRS